MTKDANEVLPGRCFAVLLCRSKISLLCIKTSNLNVGQFDGKSCLEEQAYRDLIRKTTAGCNFSCLAYTNLQINHLTYKFLWFFLLVFVQNEGVKNAQFSK